MTHQLNGIAIYNTYKESWLFTVMLCLGFVGFGHFLASVPGERYTDPVVMVINNIGQKQCIQKCLDRPSLCKGVNYRKQDLLCELVSATDREEQRLGYVRIELEQADLLRAACPPEEVDVTLSSKKSYCIKDDRGPADCTAIHSAHPGVISGLYSIELPVLGHVPVYCDMETDGGGWTVFQRRVDGVENFERTWIEYKHGFGDLTLEFWLGNDNLHYLLTQGNYEMRMDMEDFENQTRYVKYSSFSVGDESSKYTVSIFGYSGDVGDCFTNTSDHKIHQMKFSTKDQDNDLHSDQCAITYNSGWWHNKCHCSNPNGLYLAGNTTKFGKGITYKLWRTHNYSLKSTVIMVRRRLKLQ